MPAGLKRRLASWLCDDRVGRVIGAVYGDRIPLGGVRIETRSPVISPRTKAEIFWQIYESAELRFVQEFVPGDRDVVELGASIGVVSTFAARKLDPGRKLVCVEANPHLGGLVEANVRSNAPGVDLLRLQFAIDYETDGETVRLAIGSTTAGSRLSSAGENSADFEEVPRTTLSEVLRTAEIDRYTLIADIEGAEAGIIFDDAAALSRCDRILAELHDTDYCGRRHRYQDLAREVQDRHGFRVVASYGPVFVFER